MDNRDFWPYMKVATLPHFDRSSIYGPVYPQSFSWLSWLKMKFRSLYRCCYVHFHDFFLSSVLGYLTMNEKLYVAVQKDDLYKARQLLAYGASPGFLPANQKPTLSRLIRNNGNTTYGCIDKDLFAAILAGDSMLYTAVSNNNFPLIRELIQYHDYGAAGQHTEVVSLCLAVKHCYEHIVEYLIDYGHINPNGCVQAGCNHCKVNSDRNQRFQFPLYHACRDNHLSLVKYLVEIKDCDINQLTTSFETPLHGAILGAVENRYDSSASHEKRYQIVEYLLSRPNCNVNLGLNPLCVSIADDKIYDYTSLLLEHKCSVDRLGWNRHGTLGIVSHKSDCHLLYPLDHPLNICLRQICGSREKKFADGYFSYRKCALSLIKAKCNIYAMHDYGPTYPLILAVQTGDASIVRIMLEEAAAQIRLDLVEPLILASEKLYFDMVKSLVDFGFNPNTIMIDRGLTSLKNPSSDELNRGNFLTYLDRYCLTSSRALFIDNHLAKTSASDEQRITPFLALSGMPGWIFHRDSHLATMRTVANLVSHHPIDFSIRSNRLAFHFALLNEHMPLIYYSLANFCPVDLLYGAIEFRSFDLQNHFTYTLFSVISLCVRLTSNTTIRRTILKAYANSLLTNMPSISSSTVLAYVTLWTNDEDLADDPTVLAHLMSLPKMDEVLGSFDHQTLESAFGSYYSHMVEYRSSSKPVCSLKHLCRLKIRQEAHVYCQRRQVNMLKVLNSFDYCLPRSLQAYLFYTRAKSDKLINHLMRGLPWNELLWVVTTC